MVGRRGADPLSPSGQDRATQHAKQNNNELKGKLAPLPRVVKTLKGKKKIRLPRPSSSHRWQEKARKKYFHTTRVAVRAAEVAAAATTATRTTAANTTKFGDAKTRRKKRREKTKRTLCSMTQNHTWHTEVAETAKRLLTIRSFLICTLTPHTSSSTKGVQGGDYYALRTQC